MSSHRFSRRHLIAGLALIAFLVVLLTLGAAAQDPDQSQATNLPEKVTVVEEVEIPAAAAEPNVTFFYKRYSADTFVPASSGMQYRYDTGGCIIRTGGTGYDHTAYNVELPEGAEITYLRLYFYDDDPVNNAIAQLMSYDGMGGLDLIDVVQSDGTPGWSSVGSGMGFSHFVHNQDESLALWLVFGTNTSTNLRLCGVRIQYKYTVSMTNLPVILNQSSP
jgi:hypothetical protein